MIETVEKMIAALVSSLALCLCSVKLLGAMQQGGYKNGVFWRWLERKDNLFFNRLSVLSLCLALGCVITPLCFSFLGETWALICSAVPFFALLLVFVWVDGKYALKVPAKRTARLCRLFAAYFLFTAVFSYAFLSVLQLLAERNGSVLYGLLAYVPFCVSPILLPVWVCLANAATGIFENARNRKFVKRAGQVLDESNVIRVAVVGSYGKTSVKNILKTLLSEKFSVVETPASFNTPMGVAKTVFSDDFSGKEVFIAEMGARKAGDIAQLCNLVKPNFAVFTGVCPQHIASFGSLEGVFAEKSHILRCGAKVVCGEGLQAWIGEDFDGSGYLYAGKKQVEDLRLAATETAFTLSLGEEKISVKTSLLGDVAAENIALAATLGREMGMTTAEIERGLAKLQPVPHRLQLMENGGVYILDDGYNCNIEGARAALDALSRFSGGKCIVTPGIVEGGVLEEELNGRLGEEIALRAPDKVILVGETLVCAVKKGYLRGGGDAERLVVLPTLEKAQGALSEWLTAGDAVLFLNDLPDLY